MYIRFCGWCHVFIFWTQWWCIATATVSLHVMHTLMPLLCGIGSILSWMMAGANTWQDGVCDALLACLLLISLVFTYNFVMGILLVLHLLVCPQAQWSVPNFTLIFIYVTFAKCYMWLTVIGTFPSLVSEAAMWFKWLNNFSAMKSWISIKSKN